MQPDIQSLTARGHKLFDKLGMLDDAERSLVRPFVAWFEIFLNDMRPKPATETKTWNVVSFEGFTSRRVRRTEFARRRATA